MHRYPPSSVSMQVELPEQGCDEHRWLSGDKINDSSNHSLHTFVSHIFTVIILPSQGHTMHNCRSKSRHWLTTESHLGHTDCPPSLAHIYTAKLFHMFHEHNRGKECTAHMLHPASQGYTFKNQHYFSDNM